MLVLVVHNKGMNGMTDCCDDTAGLACIYVCYPLHLLNAMELQQQQWHMLGGLHTLCCMREKLIAPES